MFVFIFCSIKYLFLNPPTPDRGKGRVKLLPTVPLGQFFIFQLRVGGTYSGRILPHIFEHFRTFLHSCAQNRNVTSSKNIGKNGKVKKLRFFHNLGDFCSLPG